MQAKGLKLSAEDIYSVNKASTKDAIVRLMSKEGRMFCSGEIISSQGLFLTNHHCGYGAIQKLSTNEDNILTNGFWATSQDKERPANFNIGLLRKIEDVTGTVLKDIAINASEKERTDAVTKNLIAAKNQIIAALGAERANYVIEITPFYNGNQYLAMYYEVYRDIRLVGTPQKMLENLAVKPITGVGPVIPATSPCSVSMPMQITNLPIILQQINPSNPNTIFL